MSLNSRRLVRLPSVAVPFLVRLIRVIFIVSPVTVKLSIRMEKFAVGGVVAESARFLPVIDNSPYIVVVTPECGVVSVIFDDAVRLRLDIPPIN